MKVLAPVNQKSVYHSAGELYAKIMNDDISVEKAEVANAALGNMTRAYVAEIKRAELEHQLSNQKPVEVRIIETKNFDQIYVDEHKEK